MKAPKFWQKKHLISYFLLPISKLYQLICYIKNIIIKKKEYDIPIICVGNLVVGGAGKTPIAIEIGLILKELGVIFTYLSKGYKGNLKTTLVDNIKHSSTQVGDEPLLLAEISDVMVSKNYIVGVNKIIQNNKNKLIVMDDGLQNLSFSKDLNILVIDGYYGIGNGFILPSGPLREDVSIGIKKSNIIIIIGQDKHNIKSLCKSKTVISAYIEILPYKKSKNLVAFCGIGRPSKFFYSLEESGYNLLKKISYTDHYNYTYKDLDHMILLSRTLEAKLVTTKKDWVRLDQKYKKIIDYIDMRIIIENKNLLKDKIKLLLNA